MRRRTVVATSRLISIVVLVYWLFALPQVADVAVAHSPQAIERGRYLVVAGGCINCHEGRQQPESMSGGLALQSDYGTFYVPNITPDSATGIGNWSGRDFLLALKHGRRPGGGFYYPAFPYPSYAGMTDQDALDTAAYLMSLPAIEFTAPPHEVPTWLWRWTLAGWNKLAAFSRPELVAETDAKIARGAYIARHLGHCGECHTPRNSLGIADFNREFAGAQLGEDDVEAIDAEALAHWTEEDFAYFLFLGVKPDDEFVGGAMEMVIEHNTSKLTTNDQQALAAFFLRR